MTTEERYITFDLDEIYQSLQMLSTKQELLLTLPNGTLKSIVLAEGEEGEKEGAIYLNVTNEDSGNEDKLKFDRKTFAIGLILLCQNNNIPLPRSGTKILKFFEDKVVMKISL